jgi:hypothetical protein
MAVDKKIFIDSAGRYYKAETAKDPSDANMPLATDDMHMHLTETPVTMEELRLKAHEHRIKEQPVMYYPTPGKKAPLFDIKK